MIAALGVTLFLIVLYLIVPGMMIFGILQKQFSIINTKLLFITGLSIPAAVNSVMLFYLLWIIPGLSPLVYLLLLFIPYVLAYFVFKVKSKQVFDQFKSITFKTESKTLNLILIFGIFGWLLWCAYKIILLPVDGHDVYEYLIQAEQFWQQKSFGFEDFRQHANHFVYVGLHGFAFPLQHTFSMLAYEIAGVRADLFVKFISLYYSLLLFFFGFYFTYEKSKTGIWLYLMLFIIPIGNFTLLSSIHIDTFRITLLIVFLYFFYQSLHSAGKELVILTAFIGGLQSYIHSLNFIISGFVMLILFFALRQTWPYKLKLIVPVLLVYLLSGPLHYLLDTLIGSGWIFKQIHFY